MLQNLLNTFVFRWTPLRLHIEKLYDINSVCMLLLFADGGAKNKSVVHKFEVVMNWQSPHNYTDRLYNWQV